jgi:hypothetical protein
MLLKGKMLLNLIKKCGFNKNNYYIYSIKKFNLNWQSVTYKKYRRNITTSDGLSTSY